MKNLFKAFAVLLLVTFAMSSCTRSSNRGPEVVSVNFYSAESEFLGDPARVGADYYDLFLYDRNLTQNPNGDGIFIYLQMTTDATSENEIIRGQYEMNRSGQIRTFTFEPGQLFSEGGNDYIRGSYVGRYQGNNTFHYPIEDGNIRVSRTNNHYVLSGFVNADGKQFNIGYDGQVEFYDMVAPWPETLTHGQLWYYGKAGNTNLKIFGIRLGADDVNIANFSGSGDALQIEVYAPIEATTILPDGVYPIKVDQAQVFTAIDGYYDDIDNADYGTWYYTADALSVNEGYVKTQYLTGSTYRLEFNFTEDYYRYTFGGVYEGELAFVNKTNSPVAVRSAVRAADRAPQLKELDNKELRRSPERTVKVGERRDTMNSARKAASSAVNQQVRAKKR